MMRRHMLVLAALVMAACSSENATEPPPDKPPVDSTHAATGPLQFGIVSGQNQTARAGDQQLLQPVVGQMLRESVTGRIVFRVIGTGPRAQTVVSGSPVPGAVVCAVATDSVHKLTPFTPCTNTDSAGKATFFFTPPTVAGTATSEIRGTYQSQPAIFDTAMATVMPGPAATLALATHQVVLLAGQSYSLAGLVTGAQDTYGNAVSTEPVTITGDAELGLSHDTAQGTTEGTYALRFALDSASATASVNMVADLRGPTWTMTYACHDHNPTGFYADNGYDPDSLRVTYTFTSVAYDTALAAGAVLPDALGAPILFGGVMTEQTWFPDSSTTVTSSTMYATDERPGIIIGVGRLAPTSDTLRRYAGGSLCTYASPAVWGQRDSLVLAATP